jgi:hypothetical protein
LEDARLDALDQYAHQWRWSTRDNCHAQSAGARDEDEAERRDLCLRRRADLFTAAVEFLAAGTPTSESPEDDRPELWVAALRPISDCEDAEQLRYEQPLPTDPERLEHAVSLRHTLAQAELLVAVGQWSKAIRLLGQKASHVRKLDHPPTSAEFAYLQLTAQLALDAESDTAREPIMFGRLQALAALLATAETAGDDRIAGRALAMWLDVLSLDPTPDLVELRRIDRWARSKATRSADATTAALLACTRPRLQDSEQAPPEGKGEGSCIARIAASRARNVPDSSAHPHT